MMAKPFVHSLSSARKHGGKPEDYLDIHQFMDSSKAAMADNRHRALTHNAWFIGTIIERVFGITRTNSDGKVYSVRGIAEQHVLEDYGGRYIPSAQDFLQEMEFKDWMQNGNGSPPSFARIASRIKEKNHGVRGNQERDKAPQGGDEDQGA
jgi:hypothetical protein